MPIQVSEYNYKLPPNLIANQPMVQRDHCRLMILDRQNQKINHSHFYDLVDLLGPNDVLVLNQSKVFPARLFGHKTTGAKVEILIYQQLNSSEWYAISRPGLKTSTEIIFEHQLKAQVIKRFSESGQILLKFNQTTVNFFKTLDKIGQTPIPPYIHSPDTEKTLRQKYQTVFAKNLGSAAAPTAGLHFTKSLLNQLKNKGVQIEYLTLHVGLGTFQPLRDENLKTEKLHSEIYEIDPETSERLNFAKNNGKRIISVGTTTLRALESATKLVDHKNELISGSRSTEIFIYPPYQFKFVDALITNFHLPESSLLMLVNAFVNFPNSKLKSSPFNQSFISQAYEEAITNNYRFFSFGDAMLIV